MSFSKRLFRAGSVLVTVALLLSGCSSADDEGTLFGKDVPKRTATGWMSLSDDLRSATGEVTYTWPMKTDACRVKLSVPLNTQAASANGSAAWVDQVVVNDVVTAHGNVDGSGLEVATDPLEKCVKAGEVATVKVRFRARAGQGGNERVGHHKNVTWWGGAVPVPSHATKDGWVSPVPVRHKGESVVSDVFAVNKFQVHAPAGIRVFGQGTEKRSAVVGERRTWTLNAPSVREVAFVAGKLEAVTLGDPGCEVRAVGRRGEQSKLRAVAHAGVDASRRLADEFGFCPYPVTTIATVQPGYGGMEFPALVVVSAHSPSRSPRLIAHEIGHQYFYAFVGSDPGRHPWLDESLATYAEALVNPSSARDLLNRTYPASVKGHLGAAMTYWNDHPQVYSAGVYAQGATALLKAREADPKALREAMREWLAECGQQVCEPAQFREVLREHSPAAEKLLGAAGAWQ